MNPDADSLPEGWVETTIGNILKLNYGKGLPETSRLPGTIPVYGSNGVVGYHITPLTAGITIVIGRKGTVGAVNLSSYPCWPIDTTYYIDDLVDLEPRFVLYMFRQLNLSKMDTSTAVPGLNRDDIYGVAIHLPPLAEQRRIIRQIDALLPRINAAREQLARVPAILKRFRQSVLAAACSGRLTADWRAAQGNIEPAPVLLERIREERRARLGSKYREPALPNTKELPELPPQWLWVLLPELGELNRGKSRCRPRNAPHLFDGPYPFIQTGDIAQSGGRIICHRQTYSEAGFFQSRLWPTGTICITIAANIADSAILTYPACFPDSVVGLITDETLCLKEYAEYFIRTAHDNLSQFAPETTQKNINIAILSKVAVPLPPLEEQREIVRRVNALFQFADAVEKCQGRAKIPHFAGVKFPTSA